MGKISSQTHSGIIHQVLLAMKIMTVTAFGYLAPVVQRLDNAIHRINHYPVDKC